ncbi:hypothetical protein B0T26DRAFT_716330 [Lasiosphaeria miniovina]|uniref:Uncharacterized protein n=1 Tax=Lasiosphaeria miniovina TaxID=1954250 RepID=A0AA40AC01_9PEZI|nr:uncharacterized protein B0T26DRAFT_716330 [Lasiosphaeria miniovina]KAK0713078.1 hypothetical protein B0T26DRAFT_716330 [Lasiosphaeria miniovina]
MRRWRRLGMLQVFVSWRICRVRLRPTEHVAGNVHVSTQQLFPQLLGFVFSLAELGVDGFHSLLRPEELGVYDPPADCERNCHNDDGDPNDCIRHVPVVSACRRGLRLCRWLLAWIVGGDPVGEHVVGGKTWVVSSHCFQSLFPVKCGCGGGWRIRVRSLGFKWS